MNDVNIMLAMPSLLEPLYIAFGWLTRVLYNFFGNYGLAIICLTVIVRGLLIPLNIRSQKSMLKMQALSGKQAELQRKYGDDKEKYQQALMDMQRENGAGGLSGCLLPILQLIFIWPIFRIVSGPLIYLSQVSTDNINAMIELGKGMGDKVISGAVMTTNHIGLVKALSENAQFLNECVRRGFVRMDQLVDLHFLGMDLTMTPAWNPKLYIEDPKTYFPLLIFPVLVLATSILSMQLSKIMKPGYKEEKEAKEREKVNQARKGQSGQDDATANTMKIMNWMLPVIMLYTTFTMPAAMGLYWVVGSLMGILTQIIVYYMFTKPYEKKKAEIEAKKEAVFKKSGKAALETAGGNNSGKGKKGKKN
ncbi:MAG: YidC/Oxa1 family membrane protein insertase [Oscillospiraceae bacterium]|nr:YidC/Oxa1 family membrane protein insertase [Oscillospiraceae bacterium]